VSRGQIHHRLTQEPPAKTLYRPILYVLRIAFKRSSTNKVYLTGYKVNLYLNFTNGRNVAALPPNKAVEVVTERLKWKVCGRGWIFISFRLTTWMYYLSDSHLMPLCILPPYNVSWFIPSLFPVAPSQSGRFHQVFWICLPFSPTLLALEVPFPAPKVPPREVLPA